MEHKSNIHPEKNMEVWMEYETILVSLLKHIAQK